MKPFSLLIKPASADCNLRCAYCFYRDKSSLYPEEHVHRMSDATRETLIVTYMASDQVEYAFAWQGGEPTLMGVDFFRRVVKLQQKHGQRGSVVANSLQTNATLIDNELASHLAEYNFLVGVSLDGPRDIHDAFRSNGVDAGSHDEVIRGIERLRTHGVEFNILTLVNSENVCRAQEVYRYLRDEGFLYHQYVPCVEYDPDGNPMHYSISGQEWGDFLCGVFDEWVKSDMRQVSIRLFDSILMLLVNGVRNICHMERDCRQYFVVEYNGDVYPCDFFVDAEKRLGNIHTHSWEEMRESPSYAAFGKQKEAWGDQCSSCPYLRLCIGDCMKHRRQGVSVLCSGWSSFFRHSLPTFERLAAEIRAETPHVQATSQTGRNKPCPCGSGKKYKKCHGV